MEALGVKTRIYYPIPPFLADCYEGTVAGVKDGKERFPVAYHIATHEVSLPVYSGMPEEDVDAVIAAVNRY